MPSTRRVAAYAVHTLSLLSLLSTTAAAAHARNAIALPPVKREARDALHRRALSAMTYSGCYSSSAGLSDQGSFIYQTSGHCQPLCVNQNQAVLALSGGSDCWCGGTLPPAGTKVDDSKCSTPCNGYDSENCGGINYWSVYLSGITNSVSNADGSSSANPSSSTSTSIVVAAVASPSTSGTSTSGAALVITSVAPGTTVVVTAQASQVGDSTSSPTPTNSSGGGKPNVAGIAAGIVVGVVIAVAGVVALVFWIKHKRRKDVENEYKRSTQVSDLMRGGREPKLPTSGYSNMSDQRLDPEAGARRNSVGSIADNQDYSRKILRVANPDRQ